MATTSEQQRRVVSGMRPTGQLHLGNYHGALANWVELQYRYECFFFVADWHALTTGYEDTAALTSNTNEVLIDWLAAGLNPSACTMFVQSRVPDHAELHLILSMVTPISWLERVPTYKDQIEQLKEIGRASCRERVESKVGGASSKTEILRRNESKMNGIAI